MNSAHHCGSTQVLAEELAAVQKRRPGEAGVEDRLVGLAFSGGGIRSATFGLGVLESLHKCGLLRKVDLLSTVSGGGYIGAWLSANCRRHADWLDPKRDWTPSIAHLRRYSKYLSPKVGFFSADTWSMATIWLRNTVLIQTTVILAIACALLLPHPLFELFEQWPLAGNARWLTILLFLAGVVGIAGNLMRLASGGTVPVLNATSWRAGLVGAAICLAAAWLYGSWRGLDPFHGGEVSYSAAAPVAALLVLAGFFLQPVAVFLVSLWPSDDPPQEINYTQPWVQAVVIVPLMAASYLVSAILWGESTGLPTGGALQDLETYGAFLGSAWRYWPFPLSVVFVSIWLLAFCAIRSRHEWSGLLAAFGAPFVAVPVLHALLCVVMLLLHGWAADTKNGAAHAFVWAPPLVAFAFVLTIVVLIGMMGRDSTEEVREWSSRLGAWLGIYATAWMVIAVSAVYGPGWVESALSNHFWKSVTLGGGWVGTVAAGLFAGNSESTSGSTSGKSTLTKAKELVAAVAPFLFIAGLLIGIAYGLHCVIGVNGGHEWTSLAPAPGDGLTLLVPSTWLIVFLGCLGALLLMAARVDVNEFSLNAFYRNRLVRAYLGATRFEPGVRQPQNFTGFDGADDLPLASLAGQDGAATGPLHIVNCALNLGGSSDLALHTRHGASFTLSPLHCGTAYRSRQPSGEAKEIGFVRTAAYGGPAGAPTLGQAIAVSGAAASPNMGYHTSPVVAFLLTLFNVRLGWWFPNPHEDGPDRPSPRFSLRYLFAELFGGATEKSDFVMISDGGHFENLAAYELVRRKCRVIIVSDGECDRELIFGGLGTLIRMCEVDFGAKITIDVSALRIAADASWSTRRWAVGRIEYPDGSPDGTLIYLKASMTGREDTSVLQYKSARPEFPHETTGDQFYGEDQFESYRHLGREIALEVFGPRKDDPDMTALALNLLASEDKALALRS
jgi:hypothetical protein